MSRRIEVELTSQRDDGTWTWRAAGAKQPKGVLDGALLHQGASVGDVVRVEADVEIDGIFVTAVMPQKARSGRPEPERIELQGSRHVDGVTTQLVPGRKERGEGRSRGRGGDGRRGERGERNDRGNRERGQRERRSDNQRERGNNRNDGDRGPRRRDGERRRDSAPARPRPKKLRPGQTNRRAFVDGLPEEQRVIAETLIRGGIAAVRQEIEAQNARAASEGGPEVAAGPLVALAESLLPGLRQAEWRDRAEAAIAGIEEIDLRDLRAVLVGAEDEARDPDARAMAEQLREGLNNRVERAQGEWHAELRTILGEGRVVRALRLASRPPKAGAPLPPDIAEQLAAQANEALIGDITQQRLAIVLEAVAFSPIRPYVVLPAVPENPEPELLETVQKIADRLPEIAQRFGIAPAQRKRGRGRGPRKTPGPAPAEDSDAQDAASGSTEPSPDRDTQDLEPHAATESAPDVQGEGGSDEPASSPVSDPEVTAKSDPDRESEGSGPVASAAEADEHEVAAEEDPAGN